MASVYTPAQLSLWEHYVSLPQKYRHTTTSSPPLDIAYLTALHTHQITTFPYENLDLHYSSHHSISLDPQVQFDKMVSDARGRGGYCMQGNLMYNQILKAAGFEVYTAGVRIRPRVEGVPKGEFSGWVHVVNIITLPTGQKYVSDVSFGGDGPTLPIPLTQNHVQTNLGTQQIRLIHSPLPTSPSEVAHNPHTPRPPFWIYQYRNQPCEEWNSFYAFLEMEFFMNDFVGMNWYTSTFQGGTNFQTERVLVVRFLREGGEVNGERGNGSGADECEEETTGFVTGKLMLVNDVVKRNDGRGKTVTVRVCKSEEERIEVLKEMFGITLSEEERLGIRGWRTEILS